MFVDASAICAILLGEPEATELAHRLEATQSPPITSAVAVYEAVLAIASRKGGGLATARRDVATFLNLSSIETVSIGAAEREAALDAFERFGKGRHPARLNMGDCFAYACARTHQVPLLFKGSDFPQTDVWLA